MKKRNNRGNTKRGATCLIALGFIVFIVVIVVLNSQKTEQVSNIEKAPPAEKVWGEPDLVYTPDEPFEGDWRDYGAMILSPLKVPQVILGENSIHRKKIIDCPELHHITDMRILDNDQVLCVGRGGYVVVDMGYREIKKILFKPAGDGSPISDADDIDFLCTDLDNNGEIEFLSLGAWHYPVCMYDLNGGLLWEYPYSGINGTSVGNVFGDADQEIIIAGSDDNLHILNNEGDLERKIPGGYFTDAIVLPNTRNPTGKDTILLTDVSANLYMYNQNGTGKIEQTSQKAGHFAVSQIPGDMAKDRLFIVSDNLIEVSEVSGANITNLRAPMAASVFNPEVEHINIKGSKRPYFAVLLKTKSERSLLYIYDPDGHLIYHEVIGEDCSSLLSIPDHSEGVLLVGGKGKVFEYSFLK